MSRQQNREVPRITLRDRLIAIKRGIQSDRSTLQFYVDYLENLRIIRVLDTANDD